MWWGAIWTTPCNVEVITWTTPCNVEVIMVKALEFWTKVGISLKFALVGPDIFSSFLLVSVFYLSFLKIGFL